MVVCERVWRNLKKCAIQGSFVTGSRDWFATGKWPEWHTCEACRGSWRVMLARALQDKTSTLARQLAHDPNSRLVPVARSCRQNALFGCNWLFAFLIHPTINTLIPMKCRELPERNHREKQDWLIQNLRLLILQIPLLSSSPLTYPREVHLAKSFLIIPIPVRRYFDAWETVQKGPIHFGWCNGLLREPISYRR